MKKTNNPRKKPFIGWLVLGVAMIAPSFLPPTQAIQIKASSAISQYSQKTEPVTVNPDQYNPCGLTVVACEGNVNKNSKIVYVSEVNVNKNSDIIKRISAEYSIDWKIIYAICVIESNCKADTIGDSGQSYGAFQIHLPSHPNVSKEQAMDVEFAAKWTIEHGKKYKDNPSLFAKSHNGIGKQNQWYVDRFNQVYNNL